VLEAHANAELEASRTPVDKLNRSLCLDGGNGRIDVLWHHISAVEECAGHIFALSGIAFYHLVSCFEAREGHFGDRVLFMVCFVGGDDGSISGQRKMNTGERHKISLEFIEIDVQAAIESERRGDARYDLRDQPIQIGEAGIANAQIFLADFVNCFVIDHEGTIGMLQGRVGR